MSRKSGKKEKLVSLAELIKRSGLGITSHCARLRMRKRGIKRSGKQWRFKPGSSDLARAAKAISTP